MALSLSASIEAVLFAHGEPIEKKRLASLLGVEQKSIESGLEVLHKALAERGIALIETEDEVELRTSPDAFGLMKKLRDSELSRDLGKAGLETLALIMYKKGATRSEIDFVRGVNSTAALRSLLLRGLINRSEVETDRRKAKYDVTPEALAHLGVGKAEDLPRFSQFTAALSERTAPEDPDAN